MSFGISFLYFLAEMLPERVLGQVLKACATGKKPKAEPGHTWKFRRNLAVLKTQNHVSIKAAHVKSPPHLWSNCMSIHVSVQR